MKPVKRLFRWVFAGSIGLPLALLLLLGGNLWTFSRLGHEQAVAEIRFREIAPTRFLAILKLPDGSQRRWVLDGDQWQLDARVIKWRPWANLLGLDAMYRLERLSGRYADANEGHRVAPSVHVLVPKAAIDAWAWTEPTLHWLPLFDAVYGSAVYLPMVDGVAYHISLSQTGLLARPVEP